MNKAPRLHMLKNKSLQNFIKGFGSILNIFPAIPLKPCKAKSDFENLRNDWEIIGKSMFQGMEKLTNGRKQK